MDRLHEHVHLWMFAVPTARVGAEGEEPDAELCRRQQMQGAAHRPELHERALPPERCFDSIAFKAVDASPQAQLGRGHQLRVQAADRANDGHEISARGPLHEPMTLHPPCERLLPRQALGNFSRHEWLGPPLRHQFTVERMPPDSSASCLTA
jgi:hypothetical protein